MARTSSPARAVYKHNTAILHYEPMRSEDVAVSTARVVPVGASHAAGGGATLQLVSAVVEPGDRYPEQDGRRAAQQPPVAEVLEPPRPERKRPGQQRPTRVIAYNVRIVARGDEQVASFDEEEETSRMEMPHEPRFVMPNRREMQFDMPPRAGEVPHRAQHMPDNAELEQDPRRASFRMPHGNAFEAGFGVPDPRTARDGVPYEVPQDMGFGNRMPGGPMGGSIPMGIFSALENMGGRLHERTRRVAARAQASATNGSYKQLLTQQLELRRGGLLSERNMCIAVAAYAFILFLFAVFSG